MGIHGSRREPWRKRDWLFVAGILLVTIIVMINVVPLNRIGSELHYGDATSFTYILCWCADSWWSRPLQLFNAPFFYPHTSTLANTDACILPSILATPVWILSHNFILTYNFALYLSTFLSLVAVYFTLRTITPVSRWGAFGGAVLAAVNADRFWHIVGHLNLVWTGILAIGFLVGWLLAEKPGGRSMVFVVIAMAASLLFSWYFLILTGFCVALGFLAGFLILRKDKSSLVRSVLWFLPAMILTMLLISPIAMVYFRARSQSAARERGGIEESADLAASFEGWFYPPLQEGRLATPFGKMFDENRVNTSRSEDSQFVGYGLFLILLCEIARLCFRAGKRRFTSLDAFSLFCILSAIAALFLSLGPRLTESGMKGPYYILHFVFLRYTRFFRNPSRFSFIFQLLSGMSAAIFLTAISRKSRAAGAAVCLVAVSFALFEHWPLELTKRYTPSRISIISKIDEFDESGKESFLLLPDPTNCYGGLSTWPGWRPMVNGFTASALFPDYDHFFAMIDDFPSTRSLAHIAKRNTRWIVLTDPATITEAKTWPGLETVKESDQTALVKIENPHKVVEGWKRYRKRVRGEIMELRREYSQKLLYNILLDLSKPVDGSVSAWRADISWKPGKGLLFKPSEPDFASLHVRFTPPFNPFLADSVWVIFFSEKEYPDLGMRIYWSTGEPLGSRKTMEGEVTYDKARGIYIGKVKISDHPLYFFDGPIQSMRFDFSNYPKGESVSFLIKGVVSVKEKDEPSLPAF